MVDMDADCILIIADDIKVKNLVDSVQPQLVPRLLLEPDFSSGVTQALKVRPAAVFIQEMIAGVHCEPVAGALRELLRYNLAKLVLLTESSEHIKPPGLFDEQISLNADDVGLRQLFLQSIECIRSLDSSSAAELADFQIDLPDSEQMAIDAALNDLPLDQESSKFIDRGKFHGNPAANDTSHDDQPAKEPLAAAFDLNEIARPVQASYTSVSELYNALNYPTSSVDDLEPWYRKFGQALRGRFALRKTDAVNVEQATIEPVETGVPGEKSLEAVIDLEQIAGSPKPELSHESESDAASPELQFSFESVKPWYRKLAITFLGLGFVGLFIWVFSLGPGARFTAAQIPKKPSVLSATPARNFVAVLPMLVPLSGIDANYSSSHPGWSKYLDNGREFLVFRENGQIKALQVISKAANGIQPKEIEAMLKDLTGSGTYKVEQQKEQDGYLLESGKAGQGEVLLYRNKQTGILKAAVIVN